ncbi:hypothetical protein KR026_006592, partial [Drosophila bipectinata]
VNFALYKRFNGYKPFLYNMTLDACKFQQNPKGNPHDLVLEKLTTERISHRLTTILPFPEGDYMFQMYWFAYGINRARFQIFVSKD